MTDPVYIVGVGMTPFGLHEKSVSELTRWAIGDALEDGGLEHDDVGSVFYGNTTQGHLEGQLMVGGEVALRAAGVVGRPVFNVENACATGSSALNLAVNTVRSGEVDVALAVGVEKMNVGDRARTMQVFDGAHDVADADGLDAVLKELGGDVETGDIGQRSLFMDVYAAMARSHMEAFGTTQRQIAAVAAKNHVHAVENVRAHYRRAMTVDEVLAGRPLAPPLTVPMCAPVTDGAAAAVVCGPDTLRRLGTDRPVEVLASVIGTGVPRKIDDYDQHVTRMVAQRAYEKAGIGPADISVAEVHDATAFAEIFVSELVGLFELGQGGAAAEAGVTALGGRIPINPSGGLVSKGHPLGATGLGQVFELVSQLRGEAGARQVSDARIALAENAGGFLGGEEAVAAVTILKGN